MAACKSAVIDVLEVEDAKEIAPFWVNVARRMSELGMRTDADLVRASHVSNTQLQHYKRGRSVPRRRDIIMKLAKALRVSKEQIESWVPEDERAEDMAEDGYDGPDPHGRPYESLVSVLASHPRAKELRPEERRRLFAFEFAAGDPGEWFYVREIEAILKKRSGLHAAVRSGDDPVSLGAAIDEISDE